jgi:hypothetical protein
VRELCAYFFPRQKYPSFLSLLRISGAAVNVNWFGFPICREKMKLEALRKEKGDKTSKISEGKDAEAAKKRKLEKSSPTDGGSKGSLDYRVVALTVRGSHLACLAFKTVLQRAAGCATTQLNSTNTHTHTTSFRLHARSLT